MRVLKAVPVILSALSAVFSTAVFAGVSEGQVIFDSFCVVCHGGLGEGETMGKPLVDSAAKNLTDADLIAVITGGRTGTGMAAYGSSLSEAEIRDVAGYIRVLQGGTGLMEEDTDAGGEVDPLVAQGETLFNGNGTCINCHSYRDSGGTIGPSLDGVSARLDADALREAVESPSKTIVAGYGVKVLKSNDGETISGRYRNESEQAIQILSEDGERWLTHFKRDLRSVTDSDESLMPDIFATLGAREQDALLAFLKTL